MKPTVQTQAVFQPGKKHWNEQKSKWSRLEQKFLLISRTRCLISAVGFHCHVSEWFNCSLWRRKKHGSWVKTRLRWLHRIRAVETVPVFKDSVCVHTLFFKALWCSLSFSSNALCGSWQIAQLCSWDTGHLSGQSGSTVPRSSESVKLPNRTNRHQQSRLCAVVGC